ncbi:hypothetical protein ABZ297_42215 [Nonomuraea sp. NPDC005983]|uniref:hypothetical protein n=1 Tax=Nonomuraea sp. NPDC005983 TaxID=3155595 RepID=UPI0033AFA066
MRSVGRVGFVALRGGSGGGGDPHGGPDDALADDDEAGHQQAVPGLGIEAEGQGGGTGHPERRPR